MKPSKKKLWRKRFVRGTKGAISILLCLLLLPFLSTSLALVEYARYQQVTELLDELEELTGISLLSDYDQYIHNRFGLMSVSQQQNLTEVSNEYLGVNAKAVGKQATLTNITASGQLTLNNPEVLRQQILDVSELTGAAHVLMEDFNLEALMNALDSLQGLNEMISMINDIADLTTAIKNAMNSAVALKSSVETVMYAVSNLETETENLAVLIYNLYQSISDNGYSIPSTLSGQELDEVLISLTGQYQTEVTEIYQSAQDVMGYIDTISSGVGDIITNLESFSGHVDTIIDKAENLGSSSGSMSETTQSAGSSLASVASEMEDLLVDLEQSIEEATLEAIDETAQEIVDTILEDLGIADVSRRLNLIARGEYFDSDHSGSLQQPPKYYLQFAV